MKSSLAYPAIRSARRIPLLVLLCLCSVRASADEKSDNAKLDEGVKALNSKDYQTALMYFQPLTWANNAKAKTNIALMYYMGWGLPKNYERAFALAKEAAAQGVKQAQYLIGLMYYDGNGVACDYRKAYFWLQKSAAQGYPQAETRICSMFIGGIGVNTDPQKGMEWCKRAAEQGDAEAAKDVRELAYLTVPVSTITLNIDERAYEEFVDKLHGPGLSLVTKKDMPFIVRMLRVSDPMQGGLAAEALVHSGIPPSTEALALLKLWHDRTWRAGTDHAQMDNFVKMAIEMGEPQTAAVLVSTDSIAGQIPMDYISMPIASTGTRIVALGTSLSYDTENDVMNPKKIRFYTNAHDETGFLCTIKVRADNFPVSNDCGLKPLKVSLGDGSIQLEFIVKSQQADRTEIYSTSKMDQTLWFDQKSADNESTYTVSVSSWVIGSGGLAPIDSQAKGQIEIYGAPLDGSKTVDSCQETVMTGGHIYGVLFDGKIQGDWLSAHCETFECFSEQSPNWNCGCDNNSEECLQVVDEHRKSSTPCAQGWIKWRNSDGKLLILPTAVGFNGC